MGSAIPGGLNSLQLTDLSDNNFTRLLLSQLFAAESLTQLDTDALTAESGESLPDGNNLPFIAGLAGAGFTSGTGRTAESDINPVLNLLLSESASLSKGRGYDELKTAIQKTLVSNNFSDQQAQEIIQKTFNTTAVNITEEAGNKVIFESIRDQLFLSRLNPGEHTKTIDNNVLQQDRIGITGLTATDGLMNRNVSVNSTSAMPRYSIDAPVNQPQWGQSLAGRISMMIANHQQTAQININPPELGPIEVRITVSNDQANVNFFAHHGEVRDAIEEAFPRLKEMLGQSGLHLGESNVSEHSLSEGHEQNDEVEADVTGYKQDMDSHDENIRQNISGEVTIGYIDHYV